MVKPVGCLKEETGKRSQHSRFKKKISNRKQVNTLGLQGGPGHVKWCYVDNTCTNFVVIKRIKNSAMFYMSVTISLYYR